ncbi:MAG TPA: hypothetical protein VGE50_05210 [Gammaproteobacteria bacterium]
MGESRTLLSIVELGGYPDFSALYREHGYAVETLTSGRKAISRLRQGGFQMVVAEFNYQREFRDRTSSLESILATVQGLAGVKVVVLYAPADREHLERLRARFADFIAQPLPVSREAMAAILNNL